MDPFVAVMHGPRPNGDVYLQEPRIVGGATKRTRTPHSTTLPDRDIEGSSRFGILIEDATRLDLLPLGRNLMIKSDRKTASERRAESPYNIENARRRAELFLHYAHCYRHPRQQALLVEFIMARDGFGLGLIYRPVFEHRFMRLNSELDALFRELRERGRRQS